MLPDDLLIITSRDVNACLLRRYREGTRRAVAREAVSSDPDLPVAATGQSRPAIANGPGLRCWCAVYGTGCRWRHLQRYICPRPRGADRLCCAPQPFVAIPVLQRPQPPIEVPAVDPMIVSIQNATVPRMSFARGFWRHAI